MEPEQSNSFKNHKKEQEQSKKLNTYILGSQPFIIEAQDKDTNFINCRIISIKPGSVTSPNLLILQLRNNLISEIANLDHCAQLIQLQLYDNRIVEIKGLDNLVCLQILDLSYNNIKKIQNLYNLPRLKKLYLLSNKIKKIENLSLQELQMLELGSNKIKQIENLEKLPNLTSLFIGKNRITQIKGLQYLTKLKQIALGPNYLTHINENLLPLATTLEELYLQQNQLSKIKNINGLVNLQILDLSYNKIDQLSGIDGLYRLQALYLSGNKIQEFGQLNNLKNNIKLTVISFFGNGISQHPDYKMKLVQMLPQIDDIDGTLMKTKFTIVSGSNKNKLLKQN